MTLIANGTKRSAAGSVNAPTLVRVAGPLRRCFDPHRGSSESTEAPLTATARSRSLRQAWQRHRSESKPSIQWPRPATAPVAKSRSPLIG